MSKISRLPRRAAPPLIPELLIGKKQDCPKCKSSAEIPWLKKLPFPVQPVDMGDGHYVPQGFQFACPTCGHFISVQLPRYSTAHAYHLFGDEAARFIAKPVAATARGTPVYFFCITLVGLAPAFSKDFKAAFDALKAGISPGRDPTSWALHFTEIMGSTPGEGTFAFSGKDEKIAFARRVADLIASKRPQLASFNFSGCIHLDGDRKRHNAGKKFMRQDIFSQSLLSTVHQLRIQGMSPRWTFDNIQDTSGGPKTEGWASEVFLGLQDTPLFSWLSAGGLVLPPTFAPPGSHFLSEIADFMSYWSAREFEKAMMGQVAELSSRSFGQGFYQGVLGTGDVDYLWSEAFPLKQFYDLP